MRVAITPERGAPEASPTATAVSFASPLPDLAAMRRPIDPVEHGRAHSELMSRLFSTADDRSQTRRYQLGRVVGRGGCGVVYEAYDSQLARRVAVKLLNPQSEGGTERAALGLLTEARAVASLTHPNIVAVYDAGRSLPGYEPEMNDAVYVVMELIDGQTLSAWGRESTRPWAEVVRLYLQAGKGLVAAHERGFVHRDFKPGNVMLDRMGRVVVLDFGLAISSLPGLPNHADSIEWHPSADSTPSMQITRTMGIVGTPAYMAPEQLAGAAIDSRCDQFSFCVALYESLVARRPFGDDRERMAAVIDRGVRAHPAPDLDALEGIAPSWLGRVLRRGLEIDPGRRYPDMKSLLGALRRGLGQRRRRIAAAILGAGLVAASAATYVATRASVDPCPSEAVLEAELWGEDTKAAVHRSFQAAGQPEAERLWGTLSGSIDDYAADLAEARVDACRTAQVGNARTSRAVACLDVASMQLQVATDLLGSGDADLVVRAADMVGELPPVGECSMGKTAGSALQSTDPAIERLLAKATILMVTGRYEEVRSLAQTAHDEAIRRGDRSAEARASIALGWLEITHDSKSIESAEGRFHAALVAAEAADDPRHELLALTGSIHVVGSVGARHAEADRLVEQAMAKLDGHSVGPFVESRLRREIGLLRYREYRYDDATEEYERSEQLLHSMIGHRPLELADRAVELGNVAIQAHDHPRARRHFERATALVNEYGGADHPMNRRVLNGLGLVALHSKQFERARMLFAELRTMKLRIHGPDHPAMAVALINEARALAGMGEHGIQVRAYDEALRIRRRYHGDHHPSVARPLTNRANAMRRLGRYDEALSNLREAAEITEAIGPTQRVAHVMILANITQLHREREQIDEALVAARKAWVLLGEVTNPPAYLLAIIEAELAMALFLRDGVGAGREHIEHAYDQLSSNNASEEERMRLASYLVEIIASEQPDRARRLAREGVEYWCVDESSPSCAQAKALSQALQDST